MRKTTKTRALAIGLAAMVLSTILSPAQAGENGTGFTDVSPNAWYAEAAIYCRDLGLMRTENGAFRPDAPMTRAMLVWAMYQLAGAPSAPGAGFPDVDPSAWYAPAVRWAGTEGVVSGYVDGRFGPGDSLTREQLAAILWRREGSPAAARGVDYADESSISDFAYTAVDWARAKGIMSGMDGYRFDPQGGLTRAQAAVVLMNYSRQDYTLIEAALLDATCQPRGLAVMPDGALLVTDSYNKVIWRLSDASSELYAGNGDTKDPYGQTVGGYVDAGLTESLFQTPWAIVPFLDGWAVSDTKNGAVRLLGGDQVLTINPATEEDLPVTEFGLQFAYPTGLAVDGDGNLYIADTHRNTITLVTANGTASTYASGLEDPMGLCWKDGALYVAEAGANRIVKLTGGEAVVVAGNGEDDYRDGAAAKASFSEPQAVAVGNDGAVYVSDTGNSAIRRIKDGVVTTLAARDVTDLESTFPVSPTGLLLFENTLYICDSFSRKILTLTVR